MPINTIINPRLETFGWKTTAQEKRGSFKLTIHKNVAVGSGLSKGFPLYCYLAKDPQERPIIVVYLDSKPRGILWTKLR
jgi:hypothetical protein